MGAFCSHVQSVFLPDPMWDSSHQLPRLSRAATLGAPLPPVQTPMKISSHHCLACVLPTCSTSIMENGHRSSRAMAAETTWKGPPCRLVFRGLLHKSIGLMRTLHSRRTRHAGWRQNRSARNGTNDGQRVWLVPWCLGGRVAWKPPRTNSWFRLWPK